MGGLEDDPGTHVRYSGRRGAHLTRSLAARWSQLRTSQNTNPQYAHMLDQTCSSLVGCMRFGPNIVDPSSPHVYQRPHLLPKPTTIVETSNPRRIRSTFIGKLTGVTYLQQGIERVDAR